MILRVGNTGSTSIFRMGSTRATMPAGATSDSGESHIPRQQLHALHRPTTSGAHLTDENVRRRPC